MTFIKKIDEFNTVNEGFFKSLFGGIGDIFKSKKSKLSSILKQIGRVKNEEADELIKIEKEIAELPKENTPEYRYYSTNLNRQSRILKSMKAVELNNLIKEAEEIIDEDPKLYAYFSSEFTKINKESKEKYIKGVSTYLNKSDLKDLVDEFERLVKDANYRSKYYEDYSEQEIEDIYPDVKEDIKKFIDMSPQQSKDILDNLDYKELKNLYSGIKEFQFDMEQILDNKISSIRIQIKKSEKEGDSGIVPYLRRKESLIKYEYKEYINLIKSKTALIEKEMKNKRYVSNN